jgi:hypothetical protein
MHLRSVHALEVYSPRVRSLALVLVAGALGSPRAARAADDDACPKEDACAESCELRPAPAEQPSPALMAKLKSIAATGHHVDPQLGATLVERRSWLGVLNFAGVAREHAKLWEQSGRYAGPCAGLLVVFWSKAIDDRDAKNAVDIYELRYRSEADARRLAALMMDARPLWDWNAHPFAAVASDRSVLLVEGRQRAWAGFRRVAEHFGWRADAAAPGAARDPSPRSCDPELAPKPIIEVPAAGPRLPLALFALGFSSSGRFAWLEQRRGPDDDQFAWSLHVSDLVNDRALADHDFRVRRPGLTALCARHGRELAHLLAENGIDGSAVPALEQPKRGRDPVAVEARRAEGSGGYDVILRGRAGAKRIGSVETVDAAPKTAPKIAGIVRSPFEPRVAVAVTQEAGSTEGTKGATVTTVKFFGGRLDKGWK